MTYANSFVVFCFCMLTSCSFEHSHEAYFEYVKGCTDACVNIVYRIKGSVSLEDMLGIQQDCNKMAQERFTRQ
jgi:hypothetical protein